jgi:2-polyprenyl-6-methoxyphenol hydroxylase-like FAD-dependent oxidoreductase
MSPFSGLGANTAMLDGADLAAAVLASDTVLGALATYEATMLPCAAANAAGAHEGLTSAITAHPEFDHNPYPSEAEARA